MALIILIVLIIAGIFTVVPPLLPLRSSKLSGETLWASIFRTGTEPT